MVIVTLNTRRTTISSTPSSILSTILNEAVRTFKVSEKYQLSHEGKVVNHLLPLRLAGIPSNARLSLSKVTDGHGFVEVKIDHQIVKVSVNSKIVEISPNLKVLGRRLDDAELAMTFWEAGVRGSMAFTSAEDATMDKPPIAETNDIVETSVESSAHHAEDNNLLLHNVSKRESAVSKPVSILQPFDPSTHPFEVYKPSTSPLETANSSADPQPSLQQLQQHQSTLKGKAEVLSSFSRPGTRERRIVDAVEVKVRFPDSNFFISTFPSSVSIEQVKEVLKRVVNFETFDLIFEKRKVSSEKLFEFYESRIALTLTSTKQGQFPKTLKSDVQVLDAKIDAERREVQESAETSNAMQSTSKPKKETKADSSASKQADKKVPKWFKLGK